MARKTVGKQSFVARDAFDASAGRKIDAEASVGKAPADLAVGSRSNEDALAVPVVARRRLVGAIVAVDGDVARQEATRGRAGENVDGQRHFMARRERPALDPDQSRVVLV